jgi:3D (Asp-Asp-Asp) domain-containing protein
MSDIQSPTANPASEEAPAAAPVAAPSTAVGYGVSNPHPTSNVTVPVADTTLSWEIQNNSYHDTLPIIPTESRVDHGRILYRLKIKVVLRKLVGGDLVVGKAVSIRSNRTQDTVTVLTTVSDENGVVMVKLESRYSGDVELSVTNDDITGAPLAIKLKDAWYESRFQITHYIIANEADANGPMVSDPHVAGQHRRDFLYGARGVPMQGTGETLDHRYVRFNGGGGGWHTNAAGHPDTLNSPATAQLSETDAAHGAFADVVQDRSIAVDPRVIPGRARVHIESGDGARVVGERHADDTGGGIHGYHVDHFSGAGSAATNRWQAAGGDMTNAKIKYLGG